MARIKLFIGFLFFLVGCALGMFVLALSLDDDNIVNADSIMLWAGLSSAFFIFIGGLILSKSSV
jgi:hypothetical protein